MPRFFKVRCVSLRAEEADAHSVKSNTRSGFERPYIGRRPALRYAAGSAPARRPSQQADIFKLGKSLTFVICVDTAALPISRSNYNTRCSALPRHCSPRRALYPFMDECDVPDAFTHDSNATPIAPSHLHGMSNSGVCADVQNNRDKRLLASPRRLLLDLAVATRSAVGSMQALNSSIYEKPHHSLSINAFHHPILIANIYLRSCYVLLWRWFSLHRSSH
jgi:hypothetical protein